MVSDFYSDLTVTVEMAQLSLACNLFWSVEWGCTYFLCGKCETVG